jgi:hypothetical protein
MAALKARPERAYTAESYSAVGGVGVGTFVSYGSSLETLLLESIDESLTDLLGRRAREAVYDYLERNRQLARDEIPRRLEDFGKLLNETFGKGHKTIAKVIAKKLYSKLGWTFVEVPDYELTDYLDAVKARLVRELARMGSRSIKQ